MKRITKYRLSVVGAFVLAAATPAAAKLYLTGGSYDAADNQYQNDFIYVGRDSDGNTASNGTPYVAALTVKAGGNVSGAQGFNNSAINVTGGSVTYDSGYDTTTLNISGGAVTNASGFDASTTNLSGGNVVNAYGYGTSIMNISGGNVANGSLLISADAVVNFVGTGLSYAYSGYNYNNPYDYYADTFIISGSFAGASHSYAIYLYKQKTPGVSADGTPRQFTFNGAAVVPEAGTLAFVLPALAIGALACYRFRASDLSRRVSGVDMYMDGGASLLRGGGRQCFRQCFSGRGALMHAPRLATRAIALRV